MEQRGSVCLSVTAQRIPLGRSEISRLDFEIPPEAQRGTLSTVEGILICAADELQVLQDEGKVQSGTARLAPSSDPLLSIRFYERTREQHVSLGFLAEPNATNEFGHADDGASTNNNIVVEPHGSVGAAAGRHAIAQGNPEEVAAALCRYSAPEEVDTLPSTCGACGTACVTRFYSTKIPYFREVIVVATTCDICSYRSAEVW